jgi:hypothetical protein
VSAAIAAGYAGVLQILTAHEREPTVKTETKQIPTATISTEEPLTREHVVALLDELSIRMAEAARECAPARPPSLYGITTTGEWPEAH